LDECVGAEEALTACEADRGRRLADASGEECAHQQEPPQPMLVGTDGGTAGSSQRAPRSTQDGYFADFKLCVSTPELVKLMVEFGHERPLLIDATFGTNDMKVKHGFMQ